MTKISHAQLVSFGLEQFRVVFGVIFSFASVIVPDPVYIYPGWKLF